MCWTVIYNHTMENNKKLHLVYFGRFSPVKNVDVVILALKCLLDARYNADLSLIGGCPDDYRARLDKIIDEAQIPQGSILFFGPQPMARIFEILSGSHYFVFPSQEPKEGHSNSLTEAMAMGVVPIVSNAGFNASICGLPELVLEEVTPEAIANKIMNIESAQRWKELSQYVYNRFKENYTETKALENIRKAASLMGLI